MHCLIHTICFLLKYCRNMSLDLICSTPCVKKNVLINNSIGFSHFWFCFSVLCPTFLRSLDSIIQYLILMIFKNMWTRPWCGVNWKKLLWDSTTTTDGWGRSTPPCRSIASSTQMSSQPHAGNKEDSCETLLLQSMGGNSPPNHAEVLPHRHRRAHSHTQVINKAAVRLYYHNRWVWMVHPTVQKYCLIDTDELTATRR